MSDFFKQEKTKQPQDIKTSILTGTASDAFISILNFHSNTKQDKIIDLTCGKLYSWKDYEGIFTNVTYIDKIDYRYNVVGDYTNLDYDKEFDIIYFDPPYFFDSKFVNCKERNEQYGDNTQTYDELMTLIETSPVFIKRYLKDNGKLILKCQDQFFKEENKYYPLSLYWQNSFIEKGYDLIDLYIYDNRRISPTAYQVKNILNFN